MAAGLTIRREALADLRALADERARETVTRLRAVDVLKIDGAVSAMALRPELVAVIDQAGPFGAGHTAPIFALPRHRVVSAGEVGTGGHIRATLRSTDGADASAIAFRAAGSPVGDALLKGRDHLMHVAGSLSIDRYQGREKVSVRILDVASADL